MVLYTISPDPITVITAPVVAAITEPVAPRDDAERSVNASQPHPTPRTAFATSLMAPKGSPTTKNTARLAALTIATTPTAIAKRLPYPEAVTLRPAGSAIAASNLAR